MFLLSNYNYLSYQIENVPTKLEFVSRIANENFSAKFHKPETILSKLLFINSILELNNNFRAD